MRHLIWARPARILMTAVLASLAVPGLTQDAFTPLPPTACASLRGLSIPALAIRLNTGGALVQTAVPVSASATDNANGDYCRVTGIVRPRNPGSPSMEFEVNLPLAWNRRVLQMGGGGYNGTLVTGLTGFTLQPATVDNPLKQGFVTLGTDGGHKSAAGFDGSFAMDDEALRNFGKESVKKGHDVAIEIIKKAYGRAPERFYFIGGSQGGHEALDAAARYPRDYDGVVAHYPAYNVTLLHLGSLNVGRALYEGGGAAWNWQRAWAPALLTAAVLAGGVYFFRPAPLPQPDAAAVSVDTTVPGWFEETYSVMQPDEPRAASAIRVLFEQPEERVTEKVTE